MHARPSIRQFVRRGRAGQARAGQGMACFKRLMPGEGRSGALCASEADRLSSSLLCIIATTKLKLAAFVNCTVVVS